MKKSLILGTRGSELALAQATLVERALKAESPMVEVEVQTITTLGDRKPDWKRAEPGEAGVKGLFTRELEVALSAHEIDFAVHSLKDLPGTLPPEYELAAVLPRGPSADLLISRKGGDLEDLPAGACVGTSSIRRARQLTALRPDLRIVDLRGNVPSRLQKLRTQQDLDAIVLAEAGLHRLGYLDDRQKLAGLAISSLGKVLFPAAGQGIVAMEIRCGDEFVRAALTRINHPPTWVAARAERELLRLLGGDCTLPLGLRTEVREGRLRIEMRIFEGSEGASREGTMEGLAENPEEVARELYEAVYGKKKR